MPAYRSRTSTHGRNMAGARSLWRATGMKDGDFGKPIIAVVNSFTQFVPGHVHLKDMGQLVARQIEAAGGVAKEFNTIAIDDGIAMGHGGMLYSLPSRDLIADSVEYMCNAHTADAMVCISNCASCEAWSSARSVSFERDAASRISSSVCESDARTAFKICAQKGSSCSRPCETRVCSHVIAVRRENLS